MHSCKASLVKPSNVTEQHLQRLLQLELSLLQKELKYQPSVPVNMTFLELRSLWVIKVR